MTVIDTNVLFDIVTGEAEWLPWSLRELWLAARRGPLIINAVVYAELAVRYDRIQDLDAFVDGAGLVLAEIPREALFAAGKAHRDYRRRGGVRTGVLSDFFIGAHAAVLGVPLLTRDRGYYAAYFPTLRIIAPPQTTS